MGNTRIASQSQPCQVELADYAMFFLADGTTCPRCGTALRAIDAEPLKPGVRLFCREHHLIFSFEPASR
jgi:hypothetical protein